MIDVTNIRINLPINNLSVGETLSFPGITPNFIEEHPKLQLRDNENNVYLGYTLTRPTLDSFVFGLAYDDKKEGRHNEDFFVLNRPNQTMEKYYKGSWEQINQRYKNTHKGDKSYLTA